MKRYKYFLSTILLSTLLMSCGSFRPAFKYIENDIDFVKSNCRFKKEYSNFTYKGSNDIDSKSLTLNGNEEYHYKNFGVYLDKETNKYGLMNFYTMEWIIEPKYESLATKRTDKGAYIDIDYEYDNIWTIYLWKDAISKGIYDNYGNKFCDNASYNIETYHDGETNQIIRNGFNKTDNKIAFSGYYEGNKFIYDETPKDYKYSRLTKEGLFDLSYVNCPGYKLHLEKADKGQRFTIYKDDKAVSSYIIDRKFDHGRDLIRYMFDGTLCLSNEEDNIKVDLLTGDIKQINGIKRFEIVKILKDENGIYKYALISFLKDDGRTLYIIDKDFNVCNKEKMYITTKSFLKAERFNEYYLLANSSLSKKDFELVKHYDDDVFVFNEKLNLLTFRKYTDSNRETYEEYIKTADETKSLDFNYDTIGTFKNSDDIYYFKNNELNILKDVDPATLLPKEEETISGMEYIYNDEYYALFRSQETNDLLYLDSSLELKPLGVKLAKQELPVIKLPYTDDSYSLLLKENNLILNFELN